VSMHTHTSMDAFVAEISPSRLFTFSTHHRQRHSDCRFQDGDALIFGPETRGLPDAIRRLAPATQRVTLPMRPFNRSLNLSNAVAVAVFEAWRQLDYAGSS